MENHLSKLPFFIFLALAAMFVWFNDNRLTNDFWFISLNSKFIWWQHIFFKFCLIFGSGIIFQFLNLTWNFVYWQAFLSWISICVLYNFKYEFLLVWDKSIVIITQDMKNEFSTIWTLGKCMQILDAQFSFDIFVIDVINEMISNE